MMATATATNLKQTMSSRFMCESLLPLVSAQRNINQEFVRVPVVNFKTVSMTLVNSELARMTAVISN